ncbi:MAG: glycosyltransferase [Bacteroidaceae bacterium]|nr:glycosyltransferase [Bacteroidaceae bacterium]
MFSIIITAHNQAPELRKHLPAILDQFFDDFEVIVVDIASVDETKDVLENLERNYLNLRHTHTPSSARDISLERLALNIGIRSAKYDWIVITHPDCHPTTPYWLQALATHIREDHDILLGAAKYDEDSTECYCQKASFFRLWHTLANIHHILGGHVAVRADGCNMALRRDLFLRSDCFSEHLNLLTGTEELLINQLSNGRNTSLVRDPRALVVQDHLPSERLWKKRRVFYVETRRHQRHTSLFRVKQNSILLLAWILLLGPSLLLLLLLHLHPEQQSICFAVSALAELLAIIIIINRQMTLRKQARHLGYQRTFVLSGYFLTLLIPFWNLSAWLTYLKSPKSEFRKKFV